MPSIEDKQRIPLCHGNAEGVDTGRKLQSCKGIMQQATLWQFFLENWQSPALNTTTLAISMRDQTHVAWWLSESRWLQWKPVPDGISQLLVILVLLISSWNTNKFPALALLYHSFLHSNSRPISHALQSHFFILLDILQQLPTNHNDPPHKHWMFLLA
jgi:hypothetical protein